MNKATYTLPESFIGVFDAMKKIYKLSKSQTVEACLLNTFKLMEEELHDPNPQPVKKKYPDTVPITVSLSDYVYYRLENYAKKLDIKKSHLVTASIIYTLLMDEKETQKLDTEIDELMEVVEDAYCENFS